MVCGTKAGTFLRLFIINTSSGFVYSLGQVNVLRGLRGAEMRSTHHFCAFTSAADKAAAHQELLLRSARKAEAGRRGQPHVTIPKKFSPDN